MENHFIVDENIDESVFFLESNISSTKSDNKKPKIIRLSISKVILFKGWLK